MQEEASNAPNDTHVSWQSAVQDVEKQLELLSDAFGGLRLAVRRLAMAGQLGEANNPASLPSLVAPREEFGTRRDTPSLSAEPSTAALEAAAAARQELHRAAGEAGLSLSEGTWPGSPTEPRSVETNLWPERDTETELPPDQTEPVDYEAARDEVRRAVEAARAEFGNDTPANTETPGDPDANARDEVRRAVEAARAELGGPSFRFDDSAQIGEAPRPDIAGAMEHAWQKNAAVELSGLPPTLIIEDEEGRVELARVYETLIRLNCAGQASLQNYTPHSVTVGLTGSTPVPSDEELISAVSAIFGRHSEVSHDGSRVSVRIGQSRGKVA